MELFEQVLDSYLECLEIFRKKGDWKRDFNMYTLLYTSAVKMSDEQSKSCELYNLYKRKIQRCVNQAVEALSDKSVNVD